MGFIIAAAIILLILLIKISISVVLTDELSVSVGVGFLRLRILPSKEKELKLSDYKIKRFRKIKARKEKKAAKASRKANEKKSRKRVDRTSAKVAKAKRRSGHADASKKDTAGLIGIIAQTAKTFIARFGKHLCIGVRRLKIAVGSDNAARTAVTYGAVCGAVQGLMEALYTAGTLKLPQNGDSICVVPDFTAQKITADVDISFSFRVWQVLDMAFRAAFTFIKKYIDKNN